jgi:hypothetical protein
MTAAVFTENWFDTPSQEALVTLYEKTRDVYGAVVEVGCWEGRSTIALANVCKPDLVYAVDTWEGSPGEVSADLAAERDVYGRFRANVGAETTGNVMPFRMDWRSFFRDHARPIRFLHIDATHTYEEVRDNIAAALPHMVPGSIICGDDAHHPPVKQAVLEQFPNAYRLATLWWHQL